MRYPTLPVLGVISFTALMMTSMITDAIRTRPAAKPAEAPADPDGFRLIARISDLERELGHREAELDALADQLDSAIGELHAAGALLEKHGLKVHDCDEIE